MTSKQNIRLEVLEARLKLLRRLGTVLLALLVLNTLLDLSFPLIEFFVSAPEVSIYPEASDKQSHTAPKPQEWSWTDG